MSSNKKSECQPTPATCSHCGARGQNPICATSPDVIEVLQKSRVQCSYKRDQVIFYSGNDPIGLFFIQSGLVKLETLSSSGSAHTLRMVGPGGILGYRSLFSGEPYHATAIAVDHVELCFVAKADVMSLFKDHPEVAMRLLSHLAKDLRLAEERWVDQVEKGAPERVAEALLFLQDHFKDQTWTRREIAEWAGTTPETVMRTLSQFEKERLVDLSGRQILIINKSELRTKAQGH